MLTKLGGYMEVTKQELQTFLETTKKQIIDKVATKQNVQLLNEADRLKIMNYVRDLIQIYQQNMLRRLEYYQVQNTRRLAGMEARMMSMEQETRAMRQLMERLADAEPQRVYMPLQNDSDKQPYTQYVYKPS